MMNKLFKMSKVDIFLKERENAWGFIFILPAYMYYIPTLLQYAILFYYGGTIDQNNVLFLSTVINCAIGGITTIFILLTMKKFMKDNFKRFKEKWLKDLLWTFTIGYALTYLCSLVGMMLQIAILGDVANQNSANQDLFVALQTISPIIMFMTSVIFAPIVEEVIFRGLIFNNLYKKNVYVAHLVSSLLFGFLHVYSFILQGEFIQFVYMIPYVIMGLSFSYAYHKRGNIIVPILLHAFSNCIAFILSYIV